MATEENPPVWGHVICSACDFLVTGFCAAGGVNVDSLMMPKLHSMKC